MKKYFSYSITSLLLLSILSCKSIEKTIDKPSTESKIVIDTIFSTNLNEPRLISTYLPKGYTKEKTYPVIYSTDGQIIIDSYSKDLDSVIENKTIREFIFVGVHSNENKVPNTDFEYRNFEYIKGLADEKDTLLNACFANHHKFFSEEVIKYIEQKYSVAKTKNNKHFYGMSNGAGFGVSLGAENPNLFSNYLCFSMAGGSYENLKWTESNSPHYYLSYGSEEPFPLVMAIKEFDEFLTHKNYTHTLHIYNGGHNRGNWKNEFLRILPEIIKK
jgi:enterochelin esterase-like enzyme